MAKAYQKSWEGDFGSGLMDTVETEMRRIGVDAERTITKEIDLKGAVDQGDLRKSVVHEISRDEGSISLAVGPDAKHAIFVLEGTRPHWAPIEPLKDWARRKVGDEGFGYYVQKKIAREGTDARDFLAGTFRWIRKRGPGRIEDAIADELDE